MIAGLPGTGLGGLFFILSALAMPFVQVVRAARGQADARTWRLVVRHVGIAGAMVVAIDVAARLLRLIVTVLPAGASARGSAADALGRGLASFEVFGLPTVVVAMASLGLLLALAALVGRLVGPPAPSDLPALQPAPTSVDPVIVLDAGDDAVTAPGHPTDLVGSAARG